MITCNLLKKESFDTGQPHLKHSFIKQNTLSTNYTNEL